MRALTRFWVLPAFLLAGSVASSAAPAPDTAATPRPAVVLPAVDALPAQALPAMIAEEAPRSGEILDNSGQIRVRFRDDVAPLAMLDDPSRTSVLQHFSICPQLPGRFQLLTPRLVVFMSEAPYPPSTRFRITIARGLTDLRGHHLDSDVAYTFETAGVDWGQPLPGDDERNDFQPFPLRPDVVVSLGQPLDFEALRARVSLVARKSGMSVAVRVTRDERDANSFHVIPAEPLLPNTAYELSIAPGIPVFGANIAAPEYSGTFHTYGPFQGPTVERGDVPYTNGGRGRFVDGTPVLVFHHHVLRSSALKHMHISLPPVPGHVAFLLSGNEDRIQFDPLMFGPGSSAIVTLDPDLLDEFGQRLGHRVTLPVSVGHLAAGISVNAGNVVVPLGFPLALAVRARNLSGDAFRTQLRRLDPLAVVVDDVPLPSDASGPYPADWSVRKLGAAVDVEKVVPAFSADPLAGGPGTFAYAVSASTNAYHWSDNEERTARPVFSGRFARTNIALFVHMFSGNAVIRTHRLDNGAPLAGTQIAFYRALKAGSDAASARPCATGTTDEGGSLIVGAPLDACNRSARGDEAALVVTAQAGDDWTFLRSSSTQEAGRTSNYWAFALSQRAPQLAGTIVTDRDLYAAGETVHAAVFAYRAARGALVAASEPLRVLLRTPDGSERLISTVRPNSSGLTTGMIRLDPGAREGGYVLLLRANDGQEMQAAFEVAAVRYPLFSVKVATDREVGVAGETVLAKVSSTYLFGAPVNGVPVRFSVQRTPGVFAPKEWYGWSFGISDPREFGRFVPTPAEASVPLAVVRSAADGSARYAVPIDAKPFVQSYLIEVEARDAANTAFAARTAIVALPSAAAVGLQHHGMAVTGAEFPVRIIVVDPAAHALAGVTVHLALQRFREDPDLDPENAEAVEQHWETQDERELISTVEPGTVTLIPRRNGRYRLTARAADARGRTWLTQTGFDAGPAVIAPSPPPRVGLGIEGPSDRHYRAGDQVRVHFWPRFSDSDVLVGAVDRSGFVQAQRAVGPGERDFTFTVSPASTGSIEAIEMRRGTPGSLADADRAVSALHGAGFWFDDDAELMVHVAATPTTTRPGTHVSIRVRVTDKRNAARAASLVVALVDRATLQVTARNVAGLLRSLYADTRPWQAAAKSSADDVLRHGWPPPPPLDDDSAFAEQGQPQRGGLRMIGSVRMRDSSSYAQVANTADVYSIGAMKARSASEGVRPPRYRRAFSPVAAFRSDVVTGADGFATVDVTLPGNVTTWDVIVMAAMADGRTAEGTSSIQTTQALVVNPSIPAFMRPGDRALLGAVVSNRTTHGGPFHFFADALGELRLDGGMRSRRFDFASGPAAGATSTYRIGVTAQALGAARLRLGATLGGLNDGIDVPLPVRAADTTEYVTATGRTDARAVLPIVTRGLLPSTRGGLDLALSSTLLPEISSPLTRADTDESPTSFALAARIRIATDAVIMNETYRRPLDAAAARTRLNGLLSDAQPYGHDDGGYSELPGSWWPSEINASISMLRALARAKLVNAYDPARLDAAARFVGARLSALPATRCRPWPWCPDVHFDFLAALDAVLASGAGLPQGFTITCPTPPEFGWGGARDARTLARVPQCAVEAAAIRDQILHRSRETSRSTVDGNQPDFLAMLVATHAGAETIDRALTGLLAAERDGRWGWLGNDADSLDALADTAAQAGPLPDFSAQARIGRVHLQTAFFGYRRTQFAHTVRLADLPRPSGELTLEKMGAGTLHYAATLRYELYGAQAGRYAGLRVDRFVRLANATPKVAAFGLDAPAASFALTEGAVYDVELRIVSDHDVDRVVLSDPLPAGVDPIDESLPISSEVDRSGRGAGAWPGCCWWTPDYISASRERVLAYFGHLPAGAHSIHYLIRVAVPGRFWWPGATARLERVPEDFGRSAAGSIEVQPVAGTHVVGGTQR